MSRYGVIRTQLTLWALVMAYDEKELVNIGSGNDLVPDSTKPLPEPIWAYNQCSPNNFTGYAQNINH